MSILTGASGRAVLRRLFLRSRFTGATHALHEVVVAQAREASLFRRYAVPDTLDGRFEFLILHVLLVMRRLRTAGAAGNDASQQLFDLVFADLDRALREAGVGDLGVGSRIRRMAEAFYGRARALDDALLPQAGDDALAAMLSRNVYGTAPVPEATAGGLAAYVRRQSLHLDSLEDGRILEGRFAFDGGADA